MFSCFVVCDLYHLKVNVTLAQFHLEVWLEWFTQLQNDVLGIRIQRAISETKELSLRIQCFVLNYSHFPYSIIVPENSHRQCSHTGR